jgi:serine/threonine protein kinase
MVNDPRKSPLVGPDVFPRARAIFESALDGPPADRAALIREACGGDGALAAQVEDMLRADAAPHVLLDGGPILQADRLQPGDVVAGQFRVVEFVGAGGMGDVYRAHDTTLGRGVALKMLPGLVSHPGGLPDDRVARFRREAQTLASVNHPNIAAIYGIEQVDGLHALVMEFVEGPTLADRVARGPVPTDDAIEIGRQLAMGLEAAHELGIVHRDLKPANVKVRPDGTVKTPSTQKPL